MTASQNAMILDYLQHGNTLTALEAFNRFQCLRLAARINELRNDGHLIDAETVKENGKSFARYSIGGEQLQLL